MRIERDRLGKTRQKYSSADIKNALSALHWPTRGRQLYLYRATMTFQIISAAQTVRGRDLLDAIDEWYLLQRFQISAFSPTPLHALPKRSWSSDGTLPSSRLRRRMRIIHSMSVPTALHNPSFPQRRQCRVLHHGGRSC